MLTKHFSKEIHSIFGKINSARHRSKIIIKLSIFNGMYHFEIFLDLTKIGIFSILCPGGSPKLSPKGWSCSWQTGDPWIHGITKVAGSRPWACYKDFLVESNCCLSVSALFQWGVCKGEASPLNPLFSNGFSQVSSSFSHPTLKVLPAHSFPGPQAQWR